jgi:hypothetical protein
LNRTRLESLRRRHSTSDIQILDLKAFLAVKAFFTRDVVRDIAESERGMGDQNFFGRRFETPHKTSSRENENRQACP